MPTKRKSSGKRRSRATGAVRTITRHVRSSARRVGHAAQHMPHWLTALEFAGAGYVVGGLIRDTGLSVLAYNKIPQYKQMIDGASAAGIDTGYPGGYKAIAKLAGLAALGDAMRTGMKSGKLGSKQLDAEIPFAIGTFLDDPSQGYSPQGSSQGYWTT
jgi:hypothetical protein